LRAGMLMTYVRYRIGYVSFLHVLNRYEDRHVERRLIREGVRTLRAGASMGSSTNASPLARSTWTGSFHR